MGIIPDEILTSAAPTTLILDFMPQTTQSHICKANYVYLFPTLEQELSVLAYYLSGVVTDASTVCGVVRRSAMSDATASLVRSTLVYFGMDVSAEHLQQPADDLGASIPVGCTHTVVIGMAEGDASGLLAYLKGHSTGVLLVSFDDVTKLYASIYTSFLGEKSSVTDRLVFATNLPTWTGPTLSASEVSQAAWLSTVPEFVQTLPPLEQTPAAARTFIVAMVYDVLTRGTRWGHSDLLAALYGNVTVRAGGMTFGPFTTTWGGRRQIVKNYGAQDIAVWSYTRVREPSTELLAPPRTLWLAIDAVAAAAASSTSRLPVNVALLEQGGRASSSSEEDCVELQASSSKLAGQTVLLKSGGSASPITNATSSSSRETADVSTDSTALWSLLYALATLLMLVLLYIVLLLLMWTGSWSWAVRRASSVLWRGKKSSIATPQSAAAKIRARLDLEALQDRELQRKARDSSRAPHDCSGVLTVVYVEVEKWRPLWVRQSRVMSRAVRHYHRCVRHAITEHECYEMESVEGIFVVVCPSASVGVQFGRDVVANVARLTKRDADILAAEYSNFGYRGGSVAGLRVRVAVHMGSAEQRADMGGRVRWSGAAIDDAVCAAHVAGSAGFIVFTEGVAREVKDVEGQSSLGFHLLGCRGTEELFCQQVLPLASNSSDGKPQRGETDVSIALATLSGATDGLLKAMCAAQLEAHYAGICEEERIADLQCLCHLSGVSHASHDSCSDRRCYYLALRDGMSSHLAALSDCHHGVSRAERIRAHASTANGTVTEENPLGQRSGSRFFGRTSRNTLRRTSKRRLVHFAYARGEDDA